MIHTELGERERRRGGRIECDEGSEARADHERVDAAERDVDKDRCSSVESIHGRVSADRLQVGVDVEILPRGSEVRGEPAVSTVVDDEVDVVVAGMLRDESPCHGVAPGCAGVECVGASSAARPRIEAADREDDIREVSAALATSVDVLCRNCAGAAELRGAIRHRIGRP